MKKTLTIIFAIFMIVYMPLVVILANEEKEIGGVGHVCLWEDVTYLDMERTISYYDVFGDNMFGEDSKNKIESGEFNDENDYLDFQVGTRATATSENDALEMVPTGTSNAPYFGYETNMYENHIYYIVLEYKHNNLLYFADTPTNTFRNNDGVGTNDFIESYESLTYKKISTIIEMLGDSSYVYIYTLNTWSSTSAITFIDNYMIFDLTEIFGENNEPSLTAFENHITKFEENVGKLSVCEYIYHTDDEDDIDGYDLGQAKIVELYTAFARPITIVGEIIAIGWTEAINLITGG